jgi:hypothetical protein
LRCEYDLISLNDQYDRNAQLRKLLDLHSQILTFNLEDMDEVVGSQSMATLRIATEYRSHADRSEYVSLHRAELKRIARTSGKTSRDIDGVPLLEIYADYVAIDMLMQTIEEEMDIGLSDVTKANIIYEWLVYASRILKESNGRYMAFTKSNGDIFVSTYLMNTYSRCLMMNDGMIDSLRLVNIDFESMLSLYIHDHVDMFRIITRNCEFQEIDPHVMAYYPTAIINYIAEKTDKTIQQTVRSVRSDIEADIHLLMRLDSARLGFMTDILFKTLFAGVLDQTECKVSVANLFSFRIDPMNEDIISLHELDELNHSMRDCPHGLEEVLNALFYENNSPMEAKRFFDHCDNFAILGVLSYVYLRSTNNTSGALPLTNYTSYLTSLSDFDRVAPSIPDIIGCMQFMTYHSRYLLALNELIDKRNEMVREYGRDGLSEWETIDRDMVNVYPQKYGVYISDNESESDSDAENEYFDRENYEFSDSESYTDSDQELYVEY